MPPLDRALASLIATWPAAIDSKLLENTAGRNSAIMRCICVIIAYGVR
jgi:hypothetical protein